MKKRIKSAVGLAASRTGSYKTAFKNNALIVLFHRVDNRLPGDHISVTEPEFRTWCQFLGDHFDVVPVSQLVDALASGADISCKAAITFDDGYLDNYTAAAPELERQGLPATFFIASDFIGSQAVPWWDAELPFRPEWMSWDQVRELEAAGFEIGAHTRTHIDMGVTPVDETRAEVFGCQDRYAAELVRPVRHFSYPYGRRDQINDANRQVVRDAGFQSCFSAYGGLVQGGDDLFHIQRTPISPWHESPMQLLAEAMQEAVRPNHRPEQIYPLVKAAAE